PVGHGRLTAYGTFPLAHDPPISITARIEKNRTVSAAATPSMPTKHSTDRRTRMRVPDARPGASVVLIGRDDRPVPSRPVEARPVQADAAGVAERFTFGLDDAGEVLGHPRPTIARRPLLADPLLASSASVLVVLDALAMGTITVLGVGGVSGPLVLTAMVLVISAALGSYRHRHTLSLSEGDGRYVILTAALVVPMLVLDEPPGSDVLFVAEALVALLLARALG